MVTNLLDTATWEERAALKLAADNVPALFRCNLLAISADSGSLAVLLRTGTVELWDAATGGRRATIEAPPARARQTRPNLDPIAVWSFSPDGSVLAGLRSDGQVGLWDAATGGCRLLDVVQADYAPESVPGIWRPAAEVISHMSARTRSAMDPRTVVRSHSLRIARPWPSRAGRGGAVVGRHPGPAAGIALTA